eukprot:CAMPEP_0117449966 /NCGR_PEP_ID=MMETSP0759-20121206/8221_1 /TAXON_ID=63605 /ORGANISM="Percolomonas cosmopolitus, Strain WS" /LENGTH=394 /DNA_ID=CAMNT_0005242465 /DNA_START=86 /DNA_END=1270 /DNA_ORIENTATION=-
MTHAHSSPTPSQRASNTNIFDSVSHSQNTQEDTNSVDNEWIDRYFEEQQANPYASGSFPTHPQSLGSLSTKRKRFTSKPKPRRVQTKGLYFPDYGFDPTKPSNAPLTTTPANTSMHLFPDPDQYSGIISGRNALPDELNDTIFSPMPPTFEQMDRIWEHNELSSPAGLNPATEVSKVVTPSSVHTAPAPISVERKELEVPTPAPQPAASKSALTPTPASKMASSDAQTSSPRKTQYVIRSEHLDNIFDENSSDPNMPQKNKKRTRSGQPKNINEELSQNTWLVDEPEAVEEDSFIVDDNINASAPPTKKRRKNKKLKHNEGFNSGAWSSQEHERFLDGLKKYGRSRWREISNFVGTRSRIQVASHSQKYFAKIDSDVPVSRNKKRGKKDKKAAL